MIFLGNLLSISHSIFPAYLTPFLFFLPDSPLHPHLPSQAESYSSLNTFLVSICVAQIHVSVRPDLECNPPTREPILKGN